MRIYNIVLLFSFVSIYYKVRSDSLQGGTFLNNKMMDSYVLLWIKNTGPKICIRNCMSYTGCNAVNYNKQNMTCQLLKMSYPGDHINDQSESMFTEIDKWTLVRTIYHIFCSPHSWPITGLITWKIRRVPPVEQKLPTRPEQLSSPPLFSGIRVTRFLVLYIVVILSFFLTIVLSVL